ncbi:MAG: IS21 family transposase [Acidimicrobiia bacterium]|nr:IS21 family transposase [Acidimicrobiia bacterium]MCZ7532664.1 IS21 family transposase [Acidimicrobiia bacterium]
MSRVKLFEEIRREHRGGGSIRGLADSHGVHRRTVRQAIEDAVPPPRKTPQRDTPVLGPWKDTIRGWLTDDLEVHRKQRHTAHRVWERLVGEYGAQVGESTVRRFVAQVKAELVKTPVVAVPQTHDLGAEAEVDFGELYAWLDGERVRLWMFVMRLSASGKAFHHVFGNQCGESFYEGHNLAFDYFGGVPGMIRYDNLKPAVVKVLLGRQRWENHKFVALRSHYGFDSFFCLPGIDGAHEKGGVEGEIGRFRRGHLVPVPKVASLEELNDLVAHADVTDDARVISGRPLVDGSRVTVGEHFALEQPHLQTLNRERFDVAVDLECRVDHKARICVRQAYYSVPVRLAGRKVRVRLGASHLEIFDGSKAVARHARSPHKGTETLTLDHYLEILVRKPGAMPGATALVQARQAGTFTRAHQQFWDAARRRDGDQAGTRALIDVLLQHRRLPTEAIIAALEAANHTGIVDPAVVTVEARRHTDQRQPAVVIPIGALERYNRPVPTIDAYDQLLAGETR